MKLKDAEELELSDVERECIEWLIAESGNGRQFLLEERVWSQVGLLCEHKRSSETDARLEEWLARFAGLGIVERHPKCVVVKAVRARWLLDCGLPQWSDYHLKRTWCEQVILKDGVPISEPTFWRRCTGKAEPRYEAEKEGNNLFRLDKRFLTDEDRKRLALIEGG